MGKTLLRIGGLFVVLVALGVLVLWFIGGRTYENTAEVTISATPAAVFACITKPAEIKKWVEGVKEIEPLTTDGHKVGSKSKIIIEEQGNQFEIRDEVTRSEPNRLIEVHMTSPMFDIINLFELAENSGKTTVKQTMKSNYKGLIRVFAPFMSGTVDDKLKADFQRLKNVAEVRQGESR